MAQPEKRDSNLVAAFEFAVTALAAHDDKCHTDCMADGADADADVANRNCYSATYRYCNNPSCCSAFDCMLVLSMWDTLDRPAALNDDSHSLDSLRKTNTKFISQSFEMNRQSVALSTKCNSEFFAPRQTIYKDKSRVIERTYLTLRLLSLHFRNVYNIRTKCRAAISKRYTECC